MIELGWTLTKWITIPIVVVIVIGYMVVRLSGRGRLER